MANSSVVGLLKVLLTAETAQFEKALSGADSHVTKLANTMKRDLEPSQKRINMLVRDFLGSKEIGLANDYAEAVKRAGGAAALTAADQAKVNRAVSEALSHYKALGQQAPAHLIALANATKQVQAPTDQLGASFAKLTAAFTAGALLDRGIRSVVAGWGLLVGFVESSVTEFIEAEQIQRKLTAALTAQGTAIPSVLTHFDALANKYKQLTVNSDEAIKETQALLVQVGGVLPSEMDKALDAVTNLSSGLGVDLRSAAMLVSKAFEDNFGALKKAGVDIDAARAKAEGMTYVLGQIQEKFGGQALAEAESYAGQIKQLENNWKDLKEELGRSMAASGAFDLVIVALRVSMALLNRELMQTMAFLSTMPSPKDFLDLGGPGKVMTDWYSRANTELKLMSERMKTAKAEAESLKSLVPGGVRIGMFGQGNIVDIEAGIRAKRAAEEAAEKAAKLADEAMKRAAALAKQLEADYQSYKRSLLGVSDAQKKLTEQNIRLIHEGHLPEVAALFKVGEGLDGITARMPNYISLMTIAGNAELARSKALNAIYDAMSKLVNKTSTTNLLGAGIPSAQLPGGGQFGPPGDSLMTRLTGGLPQTIMSALTGGGGLGKSIGGLVGGEIASSIGKKISGSLTGVLGKAFGSVLPGIGNLLGAGLGALLGKVFGPREGARVNNTRDEFMAANGGLKEIQATIAKFSNDPQLLAAFNRLYFTGKEGDFKSGMDAYQARLGELQARQAALATNIDRLTSSLQVFGGVVPKSLTPLLQQLLGSANLTAEMRAQFEQLAGAPTWQVLQSRAETLGITLSALGSNFSQARISDMALQYVRDLNLFADAGADANGVLVGMADELSMVVQEAVKSGAALPKTLEPYLKRLSDMGLLLDENGNRIDMGALSFKDIEDEALKQVVTVLEQIRDLLMGVPLAAQRAAQGMAGAFAGLAPKMGFDPGFDAWPDSAQLPSFAGGTHGAYMDFGPGTPVMLHGQERVSTRGEGSGGTFNIYAIDAPSFETFLKQRGGAEAVVRSLPPVVERWGGAR